MDRKRRLMENNNGWPLRSQLFDGAPFRLPLLSTAVPASAATGTTATFTRATTATVKDHEGVLRTAIAGEARFEGARRVRNHTQTTSEDFSNAAWTKSNTTVIANQATAPNGTLTADLLYPTTTGTLRFISQTISGVSIVGSTVLGISVYAKPAGMSWMYLGLPGTGSTQGAYFNLSTGAIGTIKAGASNVTMTAVGNGWYRCSLTQLDTSDTFAYPVISVADADNSTTATTNGTDGVYIWGAQLEDVTAQTTQTAGEYVSVGVPSDWQGTELVTNGTFDTDTTGWTAANSATLSATGSELTITNAGATYGYAYQALTTVIGAKYILRCVARRGTVATVFLQAGNSAGTGTLVNQSTTSTTNVVLSAEFTATATTTYVTLISDNTNNGTAIFDSVVCKPAYYHGSFVDGVKCFPTDLSGNPIPSTTLLGYQAQGARTNLCTKSQEFDAWTGGSAGAGSNPVVTANAGTAPDGTATADKVVFSAPSAGDLSVITSPAFATVAASVYTSAVYVKAFAAGDVGKQLLTRQAGASGYTAITLSADWQRLGTTETAGGVSTTFDILLRPTFGGSSGTVSCYLWGAQVELGSSASSYIATTTIAVTRNADVLTYSSAGNTSASAGWVYVEATVPINNGAPQIQIDDGSSDNRILIDDGNATNGGTRFFIQSGGAVQANIGDFSSSANIVQKRCVTWAANYAQSSQGGLLSAADTSVTTPVSFTQIGVGGANGVAVAPCTIRNVRIGQRQLSASELGAITS